jgi:hypothetical protein
MIKTICSVLCALAIVCASSGPLLAETGIQAVHPKASGNFSPVIRLAAQCKQDGKPCRRTINVARQLPKGHGHAERHLPTRGLVLRRSFLAAERKSWKKHDNIPL